MSRHNIVGSEAIFGRGLISERAAAFSPAHGSIAWGAARRPRARVLLAFAAGVVATIAIAALVAAHP